MGHCESCGRFVLTWCTHCYQKEMAGHEGQVDDCSTCAWSLLYGEDEVCIANDLKDTMVPAEGCDFCNKWMYRDFEDREAWIKRWYKSNSRKQLNNNHWESLVGPIDELGRN